jgi:hypothetical protein
MWNIGNMGDNIKDAPLLGVAAPVAKKGWSALTEQASRLGVLEADYGSTCLRLSGSRVLIDRTSGFSEDEFHRAHREYDRYGIKDYWVISAGAVVTPGFMERHGDRCLRMSHANRSASHFVINGKRYTLNSGIEFVMTGVLAPAAAMAAPTRTTLSTKHRGGHAKVTLRPESIAV